MIRSGSRASPTTRASTSGQARAQDAALAARVDDAALTAVLDAVDDDWLEPVPGAETPDALRERYVAFLAARRDGGRPWLPEVLAEAGA